MPPPAIEVENLIKRYPAAIAVDRISFTVAPGTTAAMLPSWLQHTAWALTSTYVFEDMLRFCFKSSSAAPTC
jgi:hypothetical protein